jgi:hypothetical protein
MKGWVILATNSMSLAQIFGTPGGAPYLSERRAEEACRKLARQHPQIDFLVMPISECPQTQNVSQLLQEV